LRTERLILGDCRRIIEARTEEAEPNESAGLLRTRRRRCAVLPYHRPHGAGDLIASNGQAKRKRLPW